MRSSRGFAGILGVLSCLLAFGAMAADIAAEFPSGSVTSLERADAALVAVERERKASQADYLAAIKVCNAKFLVSGCLEAVKTDKRARDSAITSVEVEAKRFQREDKARQDAAAQKKKADDAAANAEQDRIQRSQNQAAFDKKQADAASDAASRGVHAAGDAARSGAFQSKTKSAADHDAQVAGQAASDADVRARNATAFDEKQKASADRAVRVEAKRKEKEDDRARKAAQAASAPSNAAAAAAARVAKKPATKPTAPSVSPKTAPSLPSAPSPGALPSTTRAPPRPSAAN